jgi:hypothetical protein
MVQKWLPLAIALGLLACGPAKAAVTYMFYDLSDPTAVDLEFSVDAQLSPANPHQRFDSLGGLFGPYFAGGQVQFNSTPVRELQFAGVHASGVFIFIAGVPGNGLFGGSGSISIEPNGDTVATLGEMAVSGVPVGASVPEPATWALLSLGFLGLAAAVARRRTRVVS